MKQKNILYLNPARLKQIYFQDLPEITSLAIQSETVEEFKEELTSYIKSHPQAGKRAGKHILSLIQYDGQTIYELSQEEEIQLCTIRLLWQFLTGKPDNSGNTDMLLDLYHQFRELESEIHTSFTMNDLKTAMKR